MANPRYGKPDAYVTSLSGLIAGEDFCYFQPWYRARFWVKGATGDFDRAGWIAEHAVMLKAREQELVADGYTVTVEKQNTYSLIGVTAKLSGKPDILALYAPMQRAIISDVKTGQRKAEHRTQVLLYLWSIPKVRPDLTGYTFSGELCYKDGREVITTAELTADVIARFGAEMRAIGLDLPPEKTPSESECADCPIPVAECPEKASVSRATGETTDF